MPMYGGTTYHGQASTSNSLFTPPTTSVFLAGAGAVPGVKRARGNQPPLSTTSSTSTATYEDESKLGRRIVRSVPDKNGRREGSLGPPRRSSRISSSSAMATSRSAQSIGSNGKVSTSTTTRDKKRPKAGAGPSVLSDAGSDALSPMSHSHSSSPVPSSPGLSHHNQPQSFAAMVDPAAQEAEDYVAGCLRSFGNAAAHAANYESSKAIEALMTLPNEQQRSPRSLLGVGKAHMEMLNYSKVRPTLIYRRCILTRTIQAEKAFNQARQMAPHLLEGMELYSTLLWHLRLPTALSYLAQDLMTIAPRSSSAWIASGNVFSHLEDHAAALKCFKRAAQLDENCVYAYTLSGHECVVLEEWERALGFFREAVRRDERHYNAWLVPSFLSSNV
jgi:anaphase-promoting complex subunit 3